MRNLVVAFTHWRRAEPGRGEVSTQQPVKIDDSRGYQPDVMWYPPELCAPPGEPARFSGPPALVIEVLSPSTRSFDVIRKRGDYDQVGTAEVWFVDQRDPRVLQCQRPSPGASYADRELAPGDTLSSALLDGFAVPVDELFRR